MKRNRHKLSENVAIAKNALLPFHSIDVTAHAEDMPELTVLGWVKGLAGLESMMAEQ